MCSMITIRNILFQEKLGHHLLLLCWTAIIPYHQFVQVAPCNASDWPKILQGELFVSWSDVLVIFFVQICTFCPGFFSSLLVRFLVCNHSPCVSRIRLSLSSSPPWFHLCLVIPISSQSINSLLFWSLLCLSVTRCVLLPCQRKLHVGSLISFWNFILIDCHSCWALIATSPFHTFVCFLFFFSLSSTWASFCSLHLPSVFCIWVVTLCTFKMMLQTFLRQSLLLGDFP